MKPAGKRPGSGMGKTAAGRADKRRAASTPTEPRLSRQRRPASMSVEDWQRGLRRQFGHEQAYELDKLMLIRFQALADRVFRTEFLVLAYQGSLQLVAFASFGGRTNRTRGTPGSRHRRPGA